MKIGLDLRLLNKDLYSDFVLNIINTLIKLNILGKPIKTYNLYVNNLEIKIPIENINIIKTCIDNGSIKEQTSFFKLLRKDNNDLMIFFDHHKPIFYKGEYYILIHSLKDYYYQNFNNLISKIKYHVLLKQNLIKSNKIICFDLNSKNEFIEMLNIEEERIKIIPPFFINKTSSLYNNLVIDIKSKYNINNDFFIYSGGEGIEKNIDRLIQAFFRLNKKRNKKIDLVVLGEDISMNIHLRNLIIDKNLQNNIHFLGLIKQNEKYYIYENALGVIFPSLYESFPFKLSEPLYNNKPLIVSNLDSIKKILGDKAYYFSPISTSSIVETLNNFIENGKRKIDYSDILKKYNKLSSAQKLLDIIN